MGTNNLGGRCATNNAQEGGVTGLHHEHDPPMHKHGRNVQDRACIVESTDGERVSLGLFRNSSLSLSFSFTPSLRTALVRW